MLRKENAAIIFSYTAVATMLTFEQQERNNITPEQKRLFSYFLLFLNREEVLASPNKLCQTKLEME